MIELAESTIPIKAEVAPTFQADDLAPYVKEANAFLDKARGLVVSDQGSLDGAGNILATIKRWHKQFDGLREQAKAPHLTAGRRVDIEFKRVLSPLDEAKALVDEKMKSFMRAEQERARLERERLQREEEERALARAAELEAQGRKLEAEIELELAETNSINAAPASAPVAEGTSSITSMAENWTFEVTDITKVPHTIKGVVILTVDAVEVRRLIRKGGVREIPGLRIYDAGSLRTR